MEYTRMLGRNIQLSLLEKQISENVFAEKFGYSVTDVRRIFEGKLAMLPKDIKEIAQYLNMTVDTLKSIRPRADYERYVECMGSFSDAENEDRMLDIMDLYIELKEKATN